MMSDREVRRTVLATTILLHMTGRGVAGMRPCWVCANLGHGHRLMGCLERTCPCLHRMLAPSWPTP